MWNSVQTLQSSRFVPPTARKSRQSTSLWHNLTHDHIWHSHIFEESELKKKPRKNVKRRQIGCASLVHKKKTKVEFVEQRIRQYMMLYLTSKIQKKNQFTAEKKWKLKA